MNAIMISMLGQARCPVSRLCGAGPLVAMADGLRYVTAARADYRSHGVQAGELIVGLHVPPEHPLLDARRQRAADRSVAERARNVRPGYFAARARLRRGG